MKTQHLGKIREGENVDDRFIVEEVDVRRARNGSSYIHFVFSDATGRMNGRKWDAREGEGTELAPGDLLHVKGFVDSYKSQLQMIVRQFSRLDWADADPSDFLPSSPRNIDQMMSELETELAGVTQIHLRALLDAFLSDEDFVKGLRRAPAAARLHHAYLGGLLEHTLGTVRACRAVADLYPMLDRDLLLTAAFLHDTGKIAELGHEKALLYTDRGKLLGHITIGAQWVTRKIDGIDGFPAELADLLLHMVLSHHGQYDFGSPKLPMTIEALVLHFADDLDAKVCAVAGLKEAGEIKEGEWTDYVRVFERSFFFPRRHED